MAVSVVQSISVDLYNNSHGLDGLMKQNEYSFPEFDVNTPFYDFDEVNISNLAL